MKATKILLNFKISQFIKGYVSALDFTGQIYKVPDFSGGFEHDRKALAGDWQKVGNDLQKVMNRISNG